MIAPPVAERARAAHVWTLSAARRTIPQVTGTAHVAARLTGLCLDRSGHLPDNDYLAMAVRGGLLVDLALALRLTQTDDSIELRSTPTGWPPADWALEELGALDGRSLDWWLENSAVRLADVAAALVADGSWARLRPHPLHLKPRYAVGQAEALAHDRTLLTRPDSAAGCEDAAVVAIAAVGGLAGRQRAAWSADELLVRTEPVAWVCQLVTDYIDRARIDGTAVSSASQAALWSGMPY
jgi:hypothetical protein